MSTEIDKRVVEMQFNNKDFEKNAQASLTTIEKLKMALNFDGAKGLESLTKAANKVDLSNISKSADAVAVKFSAMQIAGVTAIQQLTLSFMNFGKTLWNSSFGQIKSGGMARALKIEQANFQMRALANNMYDVEKEADKINSLLNGMADAIDRSVSGTAYGYDSAASVASQLMASGLTDADKMYEHLRAIAGAAAMTGRDFENIGDIFTKVSSNGRLMTMELRQFAAAGLNMSSVLADFYGTTEQAVNEMVHDGKVSFEDFSEAVYKAFGEMAGKADETFSGVSKNVKAQLSRIGQLFAQPYIKNMIPFLVTVKAKLKEINAALAPIANTFDYVFGKIMESARQSLEKMDLYRFNAIFGGIENILTSVFLIAVQVKRAFDEVFPKKTLDELHEIALEFNNITLSLIPGPETLNGLKEFVKLPLVIAKVILKAFKSVLKGFRPIISAVKNLLGAIARFGEVFTTLNNAIVDGVKQTNILETIFVTLGTAIGYVIKLVATLIDVFRVLMSKVFNSTIFQQFLNFIASVIDGLQRVIAVALYLVGSVLNYIFSNINFNNIINALKEVKNVVTIIFGYIYRFGKFLLSFVLATITGVSSIGKGISIIFEYFKKGVSNVKDFFNSIKTGGDTTTNAIDNLMTVFDNIKERFDNLFKGLTAGKVLLVAFSVGVILLIFSLEKLIKNLANLAQHANVTFSILDILKNGITKAIQISPMLQVLVGIAVAIGAVTASIITLGKDLSSEELNRSVTVLATFLLVLTGISAILLKMGQQLPNDLKSLKDVMISLGAFSLGILGLSLSLRMLSGLNIDLKNLISSLATITILIGELAAVCYVLGKNTYVFNKQEEELKTVSVNFISLAVSVLILSNAFKALSKVDPERIAQAMLSIAEIMSLLILVVYTAGDAAKKGLNFKSGLGVSLIVGSLTSLLITMLVLTLIPLDKLAMSLVKMLVVMAPLMAFLVVVGELILKGDKLDKKRNIDVLDSMRKILSLFALTMVELTAIVIILGRIPLTQLLKGLAAITIMSLLLETVVAKFITVADKMYKEFGGNKNGYKNLNVSLQSMAKMITAFAIVMMSLGATALMLDKVSIIGVLESIAAFYLVMNSFERIVSASEKTKEAKMAPLLALAVSIMAIMSAIAMIAYMIAGKDPEQNAVIFFSVCAGIAMVLWALSTVVKAIDASGFKRPEATKTVYKGAKNTELLVLGLSAMILAIASIGLLYTKMQNAAQIKGAIAMVAEIILALVIVLSAIALLSKIKKGTSIEEASDLLTAQSEFFKSLSKFMLAIAAFIAAISASIALLSIATKDNPLSIIGPAIVVLVALIGVIIVISEVLIPKLNDAVNSSTSKDDFIAKFQALSDTVNSIILGLMGIIIAVAGAAAIVKYTKSIGEFAVALAVLAVALSGIIGAIWLIFEKIKRINKADKIKTINETFATISDMIKQIGISVGIMILSTTALGAVIKGSNIGSTIATLSGFLVSAGSLFGIIIGFAKLIKDEEVNILTKLTPIMLSLAGSISALAIVVTIMAYEFNNVSFDAVSEAIGGLIAMMGSLVLVVIALGKIPRRDNITTMLAASASIVIITTSLIAIAFAAKMLYETLTNDVGTDALAKLGKLFTSFVMILFSLGAVTVAVIGLAKGMKGTDVVNIGVVSLLVASVAASIVAIACAITLLDGINITGESASTFIFTILITSALLGAIVAFSSQANWANIISSGVMMAAAGVSVVLFANSIKQICNAFNGIDSSIISNAINILGGFGIVVTILLVLIEAISSAVDSATATSASMLMISFSQAVVSFGLSVMLFGAGVYMLAEGVNRLFEVIQTINDLNIDGQKIRNNIKQGIMGFAQGIWDSIGYVAQAIAAIITIIFEALLGSIGALVGIAVILITGFATGLVVAIPIILAALSVILKEIVEWFHDEENMELMYEAGFVLGEALTKGIVGAFAGIIAGLTSEVNKLVEWAKVTADKISSGDLDLELIFTEEAEYDEKRSKRSSAKFRSFVTPGGVEAEQRSEENRSRREEEINNKKAQKEFQKLKDIYDSLHKSRSERIHDILEEDRANRNLVGSIESVGMQASNNDKVYLHNTDSMKTLVNEGDNVSKVIDSIGDSMEETSNKTGIFNRSIENIKGTIKDEAGDIATDASKELLGSIGDGLVDEFAPDILVKLKDKFGDNIDWNLVGDVLTGKVDKSELFKSFFANGIFSADAFKSGVTSQLGDLASMFNIDLSNVKTYEEWEKYGQEVVSKQVGTGNKGSTFNTSMSRWKAEGYASAAAYADAMLKEHGTPGEALARAFLGDYNPIDEMTKKAEDATKSMTDALSGLGEAEDEAAKKTDALADSISNALDIFSEFNDTADMTGHDVLKSFMSQITGVSKWSTELKALAGKGFSQALLEDLASLGPQGYEKVHALYTMSAKEMSLFNKMYEKKLSLESTTAKDILASFQGNAADIAEVYSEELTEQMQNATSEGVQKVGEGVVSEMAVIPEQAGTVIGESAFPLTNAFAELGMSSMEAFKKQMDFEEALEAVKVFQAGIINSTTLGSKLFDELSESEEISSKKMLDNMKRQVMNVGEWVSEINTLVARGASEGLVNQLMEMGPEGKAKVDAFVKMTDSELKEANRLYEASAKLPQVSADRITKSYAQAGYNASLGFTEGIDPEAAQNAMYMLAEHSLEYLEAALDINSPSKKTMEIGVYTVEGFIAGIINETSKYKLRNACASITTIIKDSFKNNLSATTFRSIADDCMAGLANGIMASATDAAIKAAEAANKITEAVKNAFDTHSPSLIFKWIGQMLMLGLGDGIVEQGDTTAETAALTAKNVIDNVMVKLASMSEYDEQAYTPVIRPVVDMSNVDQGYNDIRSWFDQQGSISMMGNIRLNTNNENGSSDVNRIVDAINNINNQDVVDEIASLRNDISTLQDSMSRLQVVMDTGSLVGQLVQPMDQALGTRAVTNSRGRYS